MTEPDYNEIRKRVSQRYENRTQFAGHLASFIILNGLLWTGLLGISHGWLLTAFTGLWFLGLVIHFVNFVLTEARERAIERAIERERAWVSGEVTGEKPKRDPRTRLSDDGELLEVIDDDWEQGAQRRS